ncbi:glycerate kinase [Tamaricihabitans halophyticus]|uniref:Glycerate kinase n=1 Tax=Tamaricihabitans halophyticus TaxID=1262583 RepID=A0A4R2R0U9_9PSEU|nr:glycerate kinase [Tamaricihabitans halophyticus]TCP55088.1 glycerate kinase [Tamaricihabitans halophyticus]
MRVVVAPDCFTGTLTAAEAAEAIAAGWLARAPGDELIKRPLADGGPGFIDVLHAALGGIRHSLRVSGPLGNSVTAEWLEHDGTAYLESAQAVGLHLVERADRAAGCLRTGSRGVGELLLAAKEAGAHTAVVGLGGSASTDGGAGMLAALGAAPLDADGAELGSGGAALADCARLAGPAPAGALPVLGMRLVLASDVENPLLGTHGAAQVFGPQKGADAEAVERLEVGLTRYAEVLAAAGAQVQDRAGAGAAGGLGAGLLALGADRISGAAFVRERTGLDAELTKAELVLTGEGSFDWQSLRGKLITAVAAGAAERGVPCLVLAGQVSVGRREAGAVGVDTAYAVAEHAGSAEAALADPVGTLRALAGDVAGQWSREADR